jgi:ATP-dependent Zn protease
MSGGGGGGAGGQIFNIGKSKAKLFDENTDTRTSFKDVAGLEGAKEEVEEIVEVGELDPDAIHTPGIFVQRLVLCENIEKRIEQRTTRPRES